LFVGRFNFIVGIHNTALIRISERIDYAVVQTETIANDMLNFRPEKCDFFGTFIPYLQKARFIWDVIPENLEQYPKYGLTASFLRWGYCPELAEISHKEIKELDFYFFGNQSLQRLEALSALEASLSTPAAVGNYHFSVPYYVRNDYIARSKICLNLQQNRKLTHVNNFRICYLANNGVCVLHDRTVSDSYDPAGYLDYCAFIEEYPANDLEGCIRVLRENNRWKKAGDSALEKFRKITAKAVLEQLLEESPIGYI